MAPDAAGFPAYWAADVVLRDGSTMHLRPIRPSDADALQRFHLRQSPESVYLRFFAARPRLSDADLAHLTQVDHTDRVALVLVSGTEIVGVGRYDRVDEESAEVAFHVADSLQGRGLGSVLLEHLAAAARERGIRRFVADVLPGNSRMINVFRDAGYEVRQAYDDGVVTVSFGIDPTARSLAVMAEREHHADVESMRALLGATSVLVVAEGADGLLGRRAAESVLAGAFAGPVHLVGDLLADLAQRRPTSDAGGPAAVCHREVAQVPGAVDLAVLAAPPARLPALVAAAGARGARGVVVLPGGADGRELLRAARGQGVRLVGPESFGLVADGPAGRLNATLRTRLPPPGGLSLFCQSAGAGLRLLDAAERRGLGLATFLSAGQRADVSGNDALQLWLDHDATAVTGVYLESIGNPRKFSRVARRLSARKPLLALVSGSIGQVVPPGHAVRTSAAPRRVLEALLQQAGVVRVRSADEMFDVAQVLLAQPLPRGGRVAVVAGSGSLAGLVAEVLRGEGLAVAGVVVLGPEASAADWGAAVEAWVTGDGSDALAVAYVPTLGEPDPAVVAAVATGAARSERPVVATVFGLAGLTAELTAEGRDGPRTVPSFAGIEEAGRALAAAVGYARWLATDQGSPAEPGGVDRRTAQDLVAALATGLPAEQERAVATPDVARLLACYGVRLWPAHPVATPQEALAAAHELGWPVAVKSRDEHLRHRLDLGGVRLDVAGDVELRDALHHLARLPVRGVGTVPRRSGGPAGAGGSGADRRSGERDAPFEVQAMAPRGVACVVEATEDELYGPVVAFGLAGDAVELLDDVAYAVAPLTDRDVAAMVRGVRAAPRLLGYRGLPRSDLAALEDLIARIALLKDELPDVARVVLHPVVVAEHGAAVLGAQVTLRAPVHHDRARRFLPG